MAARRAKFRRNVGSRIGWQATKAGNKGRAPVSILKVVVLPAPFTPSKPKHSPLPLLPLLLPTTSLLPLLLLDGCCCLPMLSHRPRTACTAPSLPPAEPAGCPTLPPAPVPLLWLWAAPPLLPAACQ